MKRGTAVAATCVTLVGLGVLLPLRSDAFAPDTEVTPDKNCDKGPLSRPRANCAPAPVPSTGNLYDDCVARINQLRWECQCLPRLTRWKSGEQCANKHAKYDSRRGIHAGFHNGICEPQGLAQNECPGWPSNSGIIEGCLQAMWDEGPGKRFSKHGHYMNMSNTSYERVACGFAKSADGEIWSVQNFR
jgi:hypothetical protein